MKHSRLHPQTDPAAVEIYAQRSELQTPGRGSTPRPALSEPGPDEAAYLSAAYADAQQGLRRIIALGLYVHEIKARLKHGQFQQWLAEYCPEITYRSIHGYTQLTQNVLESCGLKLSEVQSLSPGGQFLLSPAEELTDDVRPIRDAICEVIDGKSSRQLMLQFKSAAGQGGDRQWEKWCRKHAKEMVNPDGTVKSRRQASKAILTAYSEFCLKKQAEAIPTAEQAKAFADESVREFLRTVAEINRDRSLQVCHPQLLRDLLAQVRELASTLNNLINAG